MRAAIFHGSSQGGNRVDSRSARCVALMAIRPEFASRLLSGEKRVEFRRRSPTRVLTHIAIYATSPVQAVVGVIEIARIERDSPARLWGKFSDVGGIAKGDFFAYFDGVTEGFAYVVRKVWECSPPRQLGRGGLPKTPPQAFQYLDVTTLDGLMRVAATNIKER